MKRPDGEIVDKARDQIRGHVGVNTDMIEISVDLEDKKGLTHTYLVSFRRENEETWKAFDITEVSVDGGSWV